MVEPDKYYKPDLMLKYVDPETYNFTVLRWHSMWHAFDRGVEWTYAYMRKFKKVAIA